ncbi:hypothetical protein NKH74_30320 [Mesorhizobium sp. M0933]|uniref:hypothetical protein n=1 Tax=Mesorhizobium sp. M0933 TaxID=2957030 RepID=UPI003338C16F
MTITVDFVVGVAAVAYPGKGGGFTKTLLRGRTSRVVVTMGMPSFFTGSGSSATALPAWRSIFGAFMHGSTSARQIDGEADGPSEPSMAL